MATTVFTNTTRTIPAEVGQAVGGLADLSGNDNHAAQATAAARPIYQTAPDRVTVDKVDDRLLVTVPTGGFTGTMVLGTDQGTASYGVTIPAGVYDIGGRGGMSFPGNAIVGQLIRDGALSAGDAAATEAYFVANGATASYGAVTNFSNFWRDWSEITSFPLIDTSSGTNFSNAWRSCNSLTSFPLIDTSSGTNFSNAWRSCNSLTSFPLIDTSSGTSFYRAWFACNSLTSFPLIDTSAGTSFSLAWYKCNSLTSFPLIDTSAGTSFNYAWYECTSLTSFPLIDTSAGTNFSLAWQNCTSLTTIPAGLFDNVQGGDFTDAFTNTALTQTSIDNILVSLVASGISAGTRVFGQSGGSAPSAAGEAAIDTLRSRGWTVTVTGGIAITASDSLSGRTLTITVDSTTGNPAPTTALTTLTLDGVDVLGDATGTGPWSYEVPDSEDSQTVAWTVAASNAEGSNTASGSEAVAANLFAPTITAAPQITGIPTQGATVGIVSATASGTQPITITDTLALGSGDVTGDISSGQYTIPLTATGGQTLMLTSVASNGISPDAQDSVSVTVYSEAQFYSYRTEQIDP